MPQAPQRPGGPTPSRTRLALVCRTILLLAAALGLTGLVTATEPAPTTATGEVTAATTETNEASTATTGETQPKAGVPEIPVREDLALPDEAIPMLLEQDLPRRTAPLLEIGTPLLDSGKLKPGLELPTGAVWRPSLWVFGAYRTGISYLDPGLDPDGDGEAEELLEWPHRLDLFFNLQLTGTERLLLGIQPLHQDGRFTTYTFTPDAVDGWQDETDLEISTLFFEADLGELFPRLDPEDRRRLDLGFAVGRQKLEIQDGIMLNDQVDSIGLTRNSVTLPGITNLRTTLLVGWNDIHRNNNIEDHDALLWGLFTELDTRRRTIEIDLAYVTSDGPTGDGADGLYWGVGSTQRYGFLNTTLRLNGSHALDRESAAVSDGLLLFGELATSPRGSHDVIYANGFWGIDHYASAARDPTAGGPLGRTGLLFAAVGLGRFRPALGNRADEAWGAALGYQHLWHHERSQLVVEIGGRRSTGDGLAAYALGARFQRKLGRRYLLQVDGYLTEPEHGETVRGLRTEIQVRF